MYSANVYENIQTQIHLLIFYMNHNVQSLHAYILINKWYSFISINMLKKLYYANYYITFNLLLKKKINLIIKNFRKLSWNSYKNEY